MEMSPGGDMMQCIVVEQFEIIHTRRRGPVRDLIMQRDKIRAIGELDYSRAHIHLRQPSKSVYKIESMYTHQYPSFAYLALQSIGHKELIKNLVSFTQELTKAPCVLYYSILPEAAVAAAAAADSEELKTAVGNSALHQFETVTDLPQADCLKGSGSIVVGLGFDPAKRRPYTSTNNSSTNPNPRCCPQTSTQASRTPKEPDVSKNPKEKQARKNKRDELTAFQYSPQQDRRRNPGTEAKSPPLSHLLLSSYSYYPFM
ncbi:hypothetical protein B296_00021149, partial [Ensete ventricosum]